LRNGLYHKRKGLFFTLFFLPKEPHCFACIGATGKVKTADPFIATIFPCCKSADGAQIGSYVEMCFPNESVSANVGPHLLQQIGWAW